MHKILNNLSMIFFIPFTLLSMIVLVVSALTTIYYDTDQGADLPRFESQNFVLLIVGVLLFGLVVLFITKKHKKALFPAVLIIEAIICLVIVFSARISLIVFFTSYMFFPLIPPESAG